MLTLYLYYVYGRLTWKDLVKYWKRYNFEGLVEVCIETHFRSTVAHCLWDYATGAGVAEASNVRFKCSCNYIHIIKYLLTVVNTHFPTLKNLIEKTTIITKKASKVSQSAVSSLGSRNQLLHQSLD